MKKKIFGIALIAIMALAAGWNFTQSKNEVKLSELALANVEALARYEIGDVVVTCSAGSEGKCFRATRYEYQYVPFSPIPLYVVADCSFTGYIDDFCIPGMLP